MKRLAFAVILCAAPAYADGYADHKAVKIWTERPCTEVIGLIDADPSSVSGAAMMAMAWKS